MIDNFARMIAGSLDLQEPWYVEGSRFDETMREVHIFVGVRKIAGIPCPKCGAKTSRCGYEPVERIWRHGDCMFFHAFVYCRRPKVLCKECGVVQVNAPFERPHSRFTLLFEWYAMLPMADMPRRKVAELLRCDEKSLASMLSCRVKRVDGKRSLSDVAHLAVDETSFKRARKYVTLAIDAWKRAVIDMQPGRYKKTIDEFRRKLEENGRDACKIRAVASDMSKTFLPAIAENFPNAESIIDKFHVKQIVLNTLDAVRKEERKSEKDKKALFLGRKLFMKRADSLDEKQSATLKELSKRYPTTGRAARIVAGLDDFYDSTDMDEAEASFKALLLWM